ncbi:DUF6232 family protein [Streptomyces sp. NPDC002133]|uniref:DUF6232 family protein n=1 Tax=Streptomyces sp. NPDC002133 TaxID=3154409 RepID=UPI00332B4C6C
MEAKEFSPTPPLPAAPPEGRSVDLHVGKRMLWVGEAAYPLHNLARVRTAEFKPRRWRAFGYFVIGSLIAYLAAGPVPELRVVGIGLVIVLFAWFLKVLTSPSQYALVIETCGEASAWVTLPDRERLRQLVADIVEAVENPEKELRARVETINFNRNNYDYGDKVNMYGGMGNVGVQKK